MKVWSLLAKQLEQNSCCALVTMIEVQGSAPREAGTRMVIRPDGGFHGTIGGGTLEWRVLADAQKHMKSSHAQIHWSKHALGPQLGQCCGGVVRLLIEVFSKAQLPEVRALAEQEIQGPFFTKGTPKQDCIKREVTIGSPNQPSSISFDRKGCLQECFGEERRKVYLFGAGHIGRALMLNMAALQFDLKWIDSRAESFPSLVPSNVEKHFTHNPVAALDAAPDGSFIVIMTHSHALDLELVHAALATRRFAYVGVIGSETKKARFRNRLHTAGLETETIDKLVCPIGITGIHSKHPAAIAVSVTAELLVRDEEILGKQQSVFRIAEEG
ncbi:xanthine dehydrogenase accessory protein XdhC [Kiloniella laminariae]|uniref:Xanthine dehydrogenase accessory protein XdhC n=1 Tax=Kiloniella laminariae TaxID=454162 RepID=A0ABT4LGN2_9PROT|nr:xanthine dehydrogenase accessory protein XdhC [Kiloniella laminariae]MCZ4280271.1 xanthine dehydrogenase accessory protein XdhC [Kiloniella laminariae]